MSFIKNKLKLARDALSKKDYVAARDAATQVLEYEPENYNANVFLGLSLLELGHHEQSEDAYRRAIELNKEQPLAWQGLSKFYERTEQWERLADTLCKLMAVYNSSQDAVKCAETWQKLLELRRERGTRLELVEVLSFVLPQSPIYTVLSTLPLPNPTEPLETTTFVAQNAVHRSLPIIEEIVSLLETQEEDTMKKEVEKRRMRLGAGGPEIIRNEVGREIWSASKLPSFYNEILNHPDTSDELRRLTDSKLLRYKQRYLHALPDTPEFHGEKSKLRQDVAELVNGVIILCIPDEMAWMIFLEGQDINTISCYDHRLVKQFLALFPSSPVAALLKGYFTYFDIPLVSEEEDDQESSDLMEEDEDPFDTILNAHTLLPNSLISNRVVSELYINELDYENAIKVAENGLKIVAKSEVSTGLRLPSVKKQFKIILATCFVHLTPPKHHARASMMIDDVLSQSPDNVTCLMGRGYVLQEATRWAEAWPLFSRVEGLLPGDVTEGLRAKEEAAWCSCQLGDLQTAIAGLQDTLKALQGQNDRSHDIARCLWRIGQCFWKMGRDDQREEAYTFFIRSLKANPTYAPAFTSLGIYYSEFSTPRDPNRATKCFQKAFELDPREADAARRLAEGFADEQEWDLVEVVARRTIAGEGGLDADTQGVGVAPTTKYLPKNAWAWKAVGAVESHRGKYASAIEAFQVALRTEPDDALSWLRLGEAYGKAGRHVAAIKALQHAQELQPDNWMCAYFIGDVKYGMGNFDEAIAAFESILDIRPSETGVLVSLCRAHLANGETEFSAGFHMRAEHSLVECTLVGLRAIQQSYGFRGVIWKTVADALYTLSSRSIFDRDKICHILQKVSALLPMDLEHLPFNRSPLRDGTELTQAHVLELAAAAYSYRISLETSTKGGSQWFDLGICLHSWVVKSADHETAHETSEKAIACLTRALQDDPGNDMYWVGLGHAHFSSNAKASQHAYIKALEINSKDATTWTNLGLLYLHHNDVDLANEALYRAQTLDPDYSVAWIGQALVATRNGHVKEAVAMFEHAVTLTASVPQGDFEFALRVFDRVRPSRGNEKESFEALLPAFFVLNRYCRSRPDDPTALHLFGLVCERLGHFEVGAVLISRAITNLESAYEDTEDPEVERRFIIANITLARLYLAVRDYSRSSEAYESALGLLEGNTSSATKVLYTQAQFGLGLASFMQGELKKALMNFEAALENAGDDVQRRGHITILLTQTMWAIQADEFKETAKAQLLECIAADPENLTAINTLAGMGVLTDDDGLVDAALAEILALPIEKRHERDPQRDVDYLLTQYHVGQGNFKDALSVVQSAVFAERSSIEVRNRLGTLILQDGNFASATAILSGSTKDAQLSLLPTSLHLYAIASSLNGDADETVIRKMQKAIKLSPWTIQYWQGLAVVRSQQMAGR